MLISFIMFTHTHAFILDQQEDYEVASTPIITMFWNGENCDSYLSQSYKMGAPQLEHSHLDGCFVSGSWWCAPSWVFLPHFAVWSPTSSSAGCSSHTILPLHTCGGQRLRSFSVCGLMLNLKSKCSLGEKWMWKRKPRCYRHWVRCLSRVLFPH